MKVKKESKSSRRIPSSLVRVNAAFHATYDRSTTTSETEAPIFVLFGDQLVLRRARKTETFLAVPAPFHALKSAVHAPVAVFVLLNTTNGGPWSLRVIKQLKKIRRLAATSLETMTDAAGERLLRETVGFLDRMLDRRGVTKRALDAFSRSCGKKIARLMDHAAKLELECLHSSVEKAVSRLSLDDRKSMQVVVAGRHQARDRSLAMQYFQKRFREKPGEDERVLYAEGADSIAEALALVGKQRVDRELARAFFGDEKRMQRDVLGDAAARILSASTFDPLDS